MRRTPALIVGGGPAGAAAAIGLARAGLAPRLIERTSSPHDAVCGGFLGWDALAALRRLGIDPAALGARPIRRLRLVTSTRTLEAPLPRAAAGLSRRALDETLLAAAADAGAAIDRGRTVKSADLVERRIRLDDGEEIAPETLVLATGKYELRGAARPRDTSGDPVGLRTALPPSHSLEEALAEVIELHFFDGGYAGLLLQEDGSANLCLSVARARLKNAGGVDRLVTELTVELPALANRLKEAQRPEWIAVSGVPYGWKARTTSPGVFRIGDQGAVIASLAGDGVAIALESGMDAANAIIADRSAETYQAGFARRAARPLAVAEGLRWAAERGMPRALLMQWLGWLPGLAPVAARLTRIGG